MVASYHIMLTSSLQIEIMKVTWLNLINAQIDISLYNIVSSKIESCDLYCNQSYRPM